MISRPSSMPNGRWQPSGCQLTSKRPQGGGMPHPGLVGFTPRISCPLLIPLVPQYFWVLMQKNTLALAQALQACTEGSGARTGILCDLAQEFQKCMAPLMTLSGDNIVEASLLKSRGEVHGSFPHTRGGSCSPG